MLALLRGLTGKPVQDQHDPVTVMLSKLHKATGNWEGGASVEAKSETCLLQVLGSFLRVTGTSLS